MELSEVIQSVWSRRRLFFATVLGAIGLAAAASLVLPKRYVAEAVLMVEPNYADVTTSAQSQPSARFDYLATQAEVIASETVALEVVDSLELTKRSDQFDLAAGEEQILRRSIAQRLLRNLEVIPSKDSNVIRIRSENGNSQLAAEISNAFIDAYSKVSVELRVQVARSQAKWLDQQLVELRGSLEGAQSRLSQYLSSEGVVVGAPGADNDKEQLREISAALVSAQVEVVNARSRARSLEDASVAGRMDEIQEILDNPFLQTIKGDSARAAAKLAEVSERYGRNHPAYVSAAAEVAALDRQLAAEVDKARRVLRESVAIAEERHAQFAAALDEQNATVLSLNMHRDQRDVLYRSIESAQGAYDSALRHAAEAHLQGRMNNVGVAVLSSAAPPLSPASPNLRLNIALAGILGVMFGAALAVFVDGKDRRVRTQRDVEMHVGLPVLAVIPPRPGRAGRKWTGTVPVFSALTNQQRQLRNAAEAS